MINTGIRYARILIQVQAIQPVIKSLNTIIIELEIIAYGSFRIKGVRKITIPQR